MLPKTQSNASHLGVAIAMQINNVRTSEIDEVELEENARALGGRGRAHSSSPGFPVLSRRMYMFVSSGLKLRFVAYVIVEMKDIPELTSSSSGRAVSRSDVQVFWLLMSSV